jgi:Fic family protein
MTRKWDVVFQIKLEVSRFKPMLDAIDSMAENLKDLPLPPSAKARIERLNIVRAIQGTTGIEGNRMTETEISDLINRNLTEPPADFEELENYNAGRVMDYIRAQPGSRLTEAIIKEIHLITTTGIQEQVNTPGKYRREFRYANNFEFPDPAEVPRLMKEYIKFLSSPDFLALHPIVRGVVAHFYCVHIHPFYDGNGRVSRAVEAYLIYHSGYSAVGFYSLANFYYRNRLDYIRQLDEATRKHDGDMTEFVEFALNGFLGELAGLIRMGIPYLRVVKYGQHVDQLIIEGAIDQRVGIALKSIADTEGGLAPREFVMRIPAWTKRLYRGKTERTLRYDLTNIRRSGLIEERDGRIYPNLQVID